MRISLITLVVLAALPAFAQSSGSYAARLAAHRLHYAREFVTEPRSPLTAADTALLDFFPADSTWLLPARLERTPHSEPFDLPTYSGRTARYQQYGRLTLFRNGDSLSLNIYQNLRLVAQKEYEDYLFVPFKDLTSAQTTYGGGRYLDFRLGDIGADGILWVDFNKAYNPYCAYSDGYNCPVPPRENHLPVAVEAGEKNFKGEKKH
jgi:uncharacterized protein (DUF1684 family)